MLPTTPVVPSQEALVASLREQLSLQQKLASEFEIDLTARDKLVSTLSTQLQNAEKYQEEVERQQTATRALTRKVNDIENICRGLEQRLERCPKKSFQRSVVDEASQGALMVMHESIAQLKDEIEQQDELATLTNEMNRLRRQVHELQKESADKEVRLAKLTKARAQDKEDKKSLNIALDSKQQELERLKRKLYVNGTGGPTPPPTRVDLPDMGSRRHSLVVTTPSAPLPRNTETRMRRLLGSSIGFRPPSSTVNSSSRMESPPAPQGTQLSASTSSLARLPSSSKPRSTLPVSHQRLSSVMSSNTSHVNDKENETPRKASARRFSMVSD